MAVSAKHLSISYRLPLMKTWGDFTLMTMNLANLKCGAVCVSVCMDILDYDKRGGIGESGGCQWEPRANAYTCYH